MKKGIAHHIFFICAVFIVIGCVPPPEQEEDYITALSQENTTSPATERESPKESKAPPALHGMFQANNTDHSVLSINPHQLFVCKRNQDVITIALYFYHPDQNQMVCSFLFYSRIYKQKEDKFIESNSHTAAPLDEDCSKRAEEKLNTTEALKGWKCVESAAAPNAA